MGIVGHRFTLPLSAVGYTVAGFLAIKFVAFLILSGKISSREIGSLLANTSENEKKPKPAAVYAICILCGIVMLAVAYTMAIQGMVWYDLRAMLATLLLGLWGTILLFYGMRVLIALLVKQERKIGSSTYSRSVKFRETYPPVHLHGHQLAADSGGSVLLWRRYWNCRYQSAKRGSCAGLYISGLSHRTPPGVSPHLQAVLEENGLDAQFSHLLKCG